MVRANPLANPVSSSRLPAAPSLSTLEGTHVQHSHRTTSDRKRDRRSTPGRTARRVTLFAIMSLLIGLGLIWRPMRTAKAFVVVQSVGVTATTPTPTDNDYTRIKNAVDAAVSGDTITLSGTFDWTEANAAASWALGNDGLAGGLDDFSILVPPNLNNITFTAASLGAATIQGPGDLASFDLEAVLFFDSFDLGAGAAKAGKAQGSGPFGASAPGTNQGWTISNVRFVDFDVAILMFVEVDGSAVAYSGTQILNNYIRVARDLTGPVTGGVDQLQNIGLHFAQGTNETISGNTIELQGDGLSETGATTFDQFSSEVGIQSETSAPGIYNGLQITNNIVRVLNAQAANPEQLRGIWENSHDHQSNITVSGNQFLNAAAGNNPAANLQRGFRVTAHSSLTTTVTYQGNTVMGANTGFEWLPAQNFAGNQPVQMISNTILNNGTGVKIDSAGSATLHFNRIAGNAVGLSNLTSNAIDAENNWWGCNFGPGLGGAGCAGTANSVTNTGGGSVDFNPWLVLRITAAPNVLVTGQMAAITADLTFNSDGVDTSGLGTVPNGTPASFAGVNGTVAPPTSTTTSGKAGSVFTATTPGAGSASTTVDMQTVSTPITITGPVAVFDVCIQDDGNPSTVFLGNLTTGAYIFCCKGVTYTGTATVTRRGNQATFQHFTSDRRVLATFDGGLFKGNGSVQSPPGTIRCTITDKDTRNNTCVCGAAT